MDRPLEDEVLEKADIYLRKLGLTGFSYSPRKARLLLKILQR
jgi:hypothetical protein